MRKFLLLLAACLGIATLIMPAQSVAAPTVTTPTTQSIVPSVTETWEWGKQAPATAQAAETNWKMGGLPNHYTICVANGYGPTAEGLIENWNWPGYKLAINVLNRCDGYSITNRMTIDNFSDSNATCLKLTNTHRTWSPAQGKEIWDQNVVVWINTASPCFDNNIELYHRIAMYVGYVLGLHLDTVVCTCIMGSTSQDINNVPYVTWPDAVDMSGVYGVG